MKTACQILASTKEREMRETSGMERGERSYPMATLTKGIMKTVNAQEMEFTGSSILQLFHFKQ